MVSMNPTPEGLLWPTKVEARLHDPAEKALLLMRDPAGHDGGRNPALARLQGQLAEGSVTPDPDNDEALVRTLFPQGLPAPLYAHVQLASAWAAAADGPQWPLESLHTPSGPAWQVAPWAQVNWAQQPVLIHPLTGECYDLGTQGDLTPVDLGDIQRHSFERTGKLLAAVAPTQGQTRDWRRTLLALWRFAPELPEGEHNGALGELWKLLPADTRVPDHSIWDHLDLTSAFAGAFAADPEGEAALLSLSIGPVQSFIAAARKMEDLWAGSHLLARLAWEGMKVVCEQLGPDAILFPRLRGVPQVDLWLRDEQGLPSELFEGCEWQRRRTDANPLFSAALPNRFVAVVPRSQARAMAEQVEQAVRQWLLSLGDTVVNELLAAVRHPEADIHPERTPTPYAQMREQLQGFPEVHWAAVPFTWRAQAAATDAAGAARASGQDVVQLSEAMRPFFAGPPGQACGFLASPAWAVLQNELRLQGAPAGSPAFVAPNPGVLYPAIHDLAERVLSAAKAVRPFAQSLQEGWRCSLTGETEWLTLDRSLLKLPAGQRHSTLWARLAQARPAWAKVGEHLGALPAIKRLWPTLFAREVGQALQSTDIGRFVVSTHTMALAAHMPGLQQCLDQNDAARHALGRHLRDDDQAPALPPRLAGLRGTLAARLPAALERLQDEPAGSPAAGALQAALREQLGHAPETYYSLLLMDGDRMGAWLAGEPSGGQPYGISYRDSFHPSVRVGFDLLAARQPALQRYGRQQRAISPHRHLAISAALNDFSLTVVRHVIEQEHTGRVIYAGGDDVMAMLPVSDLLSAMQRLRHAYSGHDPAQTAAEGRAGLTLQRGFALLNGQLMRMMGSQATASCGGVIAHHQAPLSAVRRELHAAEQRAKNEGGRNAFSLSIVKRSGGALRFTAAWGEPLALLQGLSAFLASEQVSRRAAFHILEWLDARQLPLPEGEGTMLQALLGYQLQRQSSGAASALAEPLAQRLTALCLQYPADKRIDTLRNLVAVAEFLARETRAGHLTGEPT